MSCDKLAFWPGHYQHPESLPKMVNTSVELHLSTSVYLSTSATMLLAPHVENPTTSATAPAEPQKLKKSKKSKESKLIEIPPAIPGIQPVYQGASKLADSEREKYIVPAKRILQPAMTPKPVPSIEAKLLDLAFISAAPFQYLMKQKDMEIFAVSMQGIENKLNMILMKNIKYQLNKTVKAPTDPKTVVPKEYHKFLDVFSKKALDTLLPHSKYDHQIRLLERYKDHGNSLLSKMSESKL